MSPQNTNYQLYWFPERKVFSVSEQRSDRGSEETLKTLKRLKNGQIFKICYFSFIFWRVIPKIICIFECN